MKLELTTIIQRIIISATPEEIYEIFMNPKQHAEFTGSKATCDAKVGGSFTAWDGYISGKNLELEKGKTIVQEWITSDWSKCYPPSRLELTFNKIENGTEISMIHSGVPKEKAEDLKNGWIDFYWNPLEDYFKKWSKPRIESKIL